MKAEEFDVDTMGHIVAVDPAETSGLACLTLDGELVWVDKIETDGVSPWTRNAAFVELIDFCGLVPGETLCVVEGQYSGANPHSGLTVARNAAAWQVVAHIRGFMVSDTVHPQTWKSSYGMAHSDRQYQALRTRDLVTHHFGGRFESKSRAGLLVSKSIDVQVAVLIGAHVGFRMGLDAFTWVGDCKSSKGKSGPLRRRRKR